MAGEHPAGTSSRSSRAAARTGSPSKTRPDRSSTPTMRRPGCRDSPPARRCSEPPPRRSWDGSRSWMRRVVPFPSTNSRVAERSPGSGNLRRWSGSGGARAAEDRWALVRATPLFDQRGDVRHVVNVFVDITERPGAAASASVPGRRDPGAQPFTELGSDHPARRSARGARPGRLVRRRRPRIRRIAVTHRVGTRRSREGRMGTRAATTVPGRPRQPHQGSRTWSERESPS